MSLSDEVAARIMGEIHTLTTRIDEQQILVIKSADVISDAADSMKRNSELAVKNAKAAGAIATKSAVHWIIFGVVLAGLLSVSSGWIGYSKGKDAGSSFGYVQARNEIAAAAWANTPEGKLAYQLAKAGSLEYLVHCSRPGWKKDGNVCFGYAPKNEGTYGWFIP